MTVAKSSIRVDSIVSEGNCCGCSACYSKCPTRAISMKASEEGFNQPHIDESLCIHCGACYKTCPTIDLQRTNAAKPDVYATQGDNSLRMRSSSAGVFTLLAEDTIARGGYVCGAAYDNAWYVHHVVINSLDQLESLRRSKYMQSRMEDCMIRIRELLKEGREVLFSGTPCQVAGLNKFLGKKYEQLMTVAVVCHGVPSPSVFHKFLSEVHDGEIKSINFREKDVMGWCTGTTIKYTDGYVYRRPDRDCHFFRGFLYNYFLNKICGSCPFNTIPRQEDITLGDYWRIRDWDSSLHDNKGTGLVVLNSPKGREAFDRIRQRLLICKSTPLDFAIKSNPNLVRSFSNSPERDRFFSFLKTHSYEETFQHLTTPKYDVCVVGLGFANNYGAILTNFGLIKTLEDLGKSVLMMERPKEYACGLEMPIPATFNRRHFHVSDSYDKKSVTLLNDQADTFVVGSDQLWNALHLKAFYKYFLLSFTENTKKRIAYASSMASPAINITPSEKRAFKYLFSRFDSISVREKSAVKWLRHLGVSSEHVLDPIFMCDVNHFYSLIPDRDKKPESPYAFAYILDPKQGGDKQVLIDGISNHLGISVVTATGLGTEKENAKKIHLSSEQSLSVEDFLLNIYNSELVVTDSFHGVCLSIIFNKPFVCIANTCRGIDRFESLLIRLKLENRMFYSVEELQNNLAVLSQPIDYSNVDAILEEWRINSRNFLRGSLDSPKMIAPDQPIPVDDLVGLELQRLHDRVQGEMGHIRSKVDNIRSKVDNIQGAIRQYPLRVLSIFKEKVDRYNYQKIKYLGG